MAMDTEDFATEDLDLENENPVEKYGIYYSEEGSQCASMV